MSLINRLSGVENPKLPVHQFWAAYAEWRKGKVTEADVKTAFAIVDGTDLSEWNWLSGKYDASTDKPNFVEKLHVIFLLAESSLFGYEVEANIQARINDLP